MPESNMTHDIDQDALADHLDGVRRLVRTLVRSESEADDVVQDTMVAALENRTEVRSGLRAWLSGVARNLVRRKARSEGRRSLYEGQARTRGSAPSTADVVARAAEQRRILDVVLGMEEPYRSVLLLRFIEGLPPRKIARRQGMPVETVRTQVKRGLARLRERLEGVHHGDRRELRAALALAATEPLGAAHARAVALARASGLVVLLAVGAAVVFFATREEDGAHEAAGSLSADAPGPTELPRPTEPAPDAPATPSVPVVIDQPAAPVATPQPTARDPISPPIHPPIRVERAPQPVPTPLPVRPIEVPKRPEPTQAIPEEEPKGGAEKVEEGEEPTGDDFFDGETSFTPKQAGRAIDKGVSWLTKRQAADGSWGGIQFNAQYGGGSASSEGMPAGPTALALYTLLKCKVPENHRSVRRGFEWLAKHWKEPRSSYEVSMLILALTATADDAKLSTTTRKRKAKPKLKGRYRAWAAKLVAALVEKRSARGWRYNVQRTESTAGGPEDLSSTQLAALALFAAKRVGMKVRSAVWEDILAFSRAQQMDDGPEVVYHDPIDPKLTRKARARGFAYIKGASNAAESAPRGGMTACGLANIEMARFVLRDGGRLQEKWDARPDATAIQTALYDGLAWLDKNWSSFEDPGAKDMNVYHVYYLYALERAMDLLGLKRVGRHRWYNEMGQALLNRQKANGHWATRTGRGHDVLDSCFALLFLKRATGGLIPFGALTGGTDAPADNR